MCQVLISQFHLPEGNKQEENTLKIQLRLDVTPCWLLYSYQRFEEENDCILHWNISTINSKLVINVIIRKISLMWATRKSVFMHSACIWCNCWKKSGLSGLTFDSAAAGGSLGCEWPLVENVEGSGPTRQRLDKQNHKNKSKDKRYLPGIQTDYIPNTSKNYELNCMADLITRREICTTFTITHIFVIISTNLNFTITLEKNINFHISVYNFINIFKYPTETTTLDTNQTYTA